MVQAVDEKIDHFRRKIRQTQINYEEQCIVRKKFARYSKSKQPHMYHLCSHNARNLIISFHRVVQCSLVYVGSIVGLYNVAFEYKIVSLLDLESTEPWLKPNNAKKNSMTESHDFPYYLFDFQTYVILKCHSTFEIRI